MPHLASRVHRLNQFPNQGVCCYVKREDELSCGISGTKFRKYSSLMPYLVTKGIRHLVIIAGPQSNNLLAALQMAREYRLVVTAFLLKPKNKLIQGNFKLSRLLINEQEIVWVERDQWIHVEDLAQQFIAQLIEPAFLLLEGASVAPAMVGSMTLADDIIRNEQEMECSFEHIFIDAGTGFSAIALIKGLMQHGHQAKVHVLLLAENEKAFQKKLAAWINEPCVTYCSFYPTTAKSFGSVNQTIQNEIKKIAREEGILVDPIYSAKLFYETRARILSEHIQGKVLIIHSGGVLTLAGFDLS